MGCTTPQPGLLPWDRAQCGQRDPSVLAGHLWDEASIQHYKRDSAASFPTPSPSFLLVIQTLDNFTTGTQVLDLEPQMCVLGIV